MKRNQFLKILLGGVVCLPVIGTIVAQNKDMEVSKAVSPEDEALLKSLAHNAYESHYNTIRDYIPVYPLTYEECWKGRSVNPIYSKERIGYEGGQEAFFNWDNEINKT
jgi:hypothetical protein